MIQTDNTFIIKKYDYLIKESDYLIKKLNKIIEQYEETMFESMIINYNDKNNDNQKIKNYNKLINKYVILQKIHNDLIQSYRDCLI